MPSNGKDEETPPVNVAALATAAEEETAAEKETAVGEMNKGVEPSWLQKPTPSYVKNEEKSANNSK